MKLLMFNAETKEVLTTSASPQGPTYQGYLQQGFVPVAYVEYCKTIGQYEQMVKDNTPSK